METRSIPYGLPRRWFGPVRFHLGSGINGNLKGGSVPFAEGGVRFHLGSGINGNPIRGNFCQSRQEEVRFHLGSGINGNHPLKLRSCI